MVLANLSEKALGKAKNKLEGVETARLDASNPENIVNILKEVDLAVGALPGDLARASLNCWKAAIKARLT